MERLECCLGIGDRDAFRADHLEDDKVSRRSAPEAGAQSAPRTLMDQWFQRPDTSTIYALTVYLPFFCTSLNDWPTERQVLAASQ